MIVAQGWNAWNINQLYFSRGHIRLDGFHWNFLDNNTYSISSVPVMALTIAAVFTAQRLWIMVGCGLVMVFQMHQLMILESRGTMLGSLFMCALAVYWMPKNSRNVGLVIVILLIAAILAGPPVIREFNSIFESKENLDSSADSRFKLWKAGTQIIMDYPLLGVALGRVSVWFRSTMKGD